MSDVGEKSRAGKKLKQECQDDDENSSLIPSGHISDAAAIVSLVNNVYSFLLC
jgi:hypothetical protein